MPSQKSLSNPPIQRFSSIVEVARHELSLGIREATGNNDGVPATRYNRGEVGHAWCASFCLFCAQHADGVADVAPTTKKYYDMRAVTGFEEEMHRLGWWWPAIAVFDPTTARAAPAPGDFIMYANRGGSDLARRGGRHMGIVESYDPATKVLVTIEGNMGNTIKRLTGTLDLQGTVSAVMASSGERRPVTGFARVPARVVGTLL